MNTIAYLTHPDCLVHDMGPQHPEQPERVRAVAHQLLITGLMDHLDYFAAPLATDTQITACHSPEYLMFLQKSAPGQGLVALDEDTFLTPHTLPAARRAAGAVVLATDLILSNKYERAFCNIRPPGHHAGRSRTGGFCFFNNVAVGIYHALAGGVRRIALVDFDVHHGNGSEEILAGESRVLMLSTYARQLYPHTEPSPPGGNQVNVGLMPGADGTALRHAVEHHWLAALEHFRPEMLFISAGFDAHFQDALGNQKWLPEDYIWLTQELVALANRHCDGRIISVLEGGYNLEALARCAALHVQGLLGHL